MVGDALSRFWHSRYYKVSRISKMLLSTVNSGPPPLTVDTTIFEMWLGSLSTHEGLSIPVV